MEPRSAERGNFSTLPAGAPGSSRFNGATLSRTWKHPVARRHLSTYTSFNGATLSRTWKPEGVARGTRRREASMEPRSAERGNTTYERSGC